MHLTIGPALEGYQDPSMRNQSHRRLQRIRAMHDHSRLNGPSPSKLHVALSDGFYGQIFERSSMSLKNITVPGGVIDQYYREEMKINVHNSTNKPFLVKNSETIAQLVLLR